MDSLHSDPEVDIPGDAIIDVLAHLHPQPDHSDDPKHVQTDNPIHGQQRQQQELEALGGGSSDGLDGWTIPDLRAEIVRLRQLLVEAHHPEFRAKPLRQPRKREAADQPAPRTDAKKKNKATNIKGLRDEDTGKRVDRGRRVELGKALRAKMRDSMGISADDPLPPPSLFPADEHAQMPELAVYGVPNWLEPQDPTNALWIERMAAEIIEEASNGAHDQIPLEDLDPAAVKAAARTSFINFCRRYHTETDPEQASKKERNMKSRRRWARKDLKQKKRAKAAADPSFEMDIPPTALHIDYMSSEYSSAGEDSDKSNQTAKAARRQRWTEVLAHKAAAENEQPAEGKGGWAQGQGEKVLEVRTPAWRSTELNAMYSRLDEIANALSAARTGPLAGGEANGSTKAGHVAPSHRRFVMDREYARRGKAPREGGAAWMWQSGQVGVWPQYPGDGDVTGTGVGTGNGDEDAGKGKGSDASTRESAWRGDDTGALVHALEGIPGGA